MTNEEKQILLKDLCARLLYHTIVKYRNADVDLTQYARSIKFTECKPYLRPMSSMTEEETKEYAEIWANREPYMPGGTVDFFNAHHLDYHGLIPMGLALEAHEGMYRLINSK